ncbi:MAG: polyphosphate kinase 2 family protein [Alphaproteobacteria bacterium]
MTPYIHLQPNDISRDAYKKSLASLQQQLQTLQSQVLRNKARVILVFEGMDAAGKGGVIRRISSAIDPRALQVWPIAAPKPEYKGTHYLKRFWDRLPAPGEIAIFDRSWYGRLLVERVENFASPEEWQRAYREINEFEKLLIDDGVIIKKFFLKTTLEEQKKRLVARLTDAQKHWKITLDDFRNRDKWPQYEPAINQMLLETSPEHAPWVLVETDHKKAARIEVLSNVCSISSSLPDLPKDTLGDELRQLAKSEFNLDL